MTEKMQYITCFNFYGSDCNYEYGYGGEGDPRDP